VGGRGLGPSPEPPLLFRLGLGNFEGQASALRCLLTLLASFAEGMLILMKHTGVVKRL